MEARVCGASWTYQLRTVTLPLLRPGIVAAWLLVFIASVRELGVSIFLVGPDGEPALELTTTWYEAFRWRMGRRSRSQLAALDWSGDPSPVLDHLVIFGPATVDVIE